MFENIFKKSPYCIQKSIKKIYKSVPYEKRLGKEFMYMYKFLQISQWWTRKQHEEYQMMQLERLLYHAYKNVPYYTKVFNERGLKPKDIQNFNDLKQLPYLTKEIIQNNIKDLTAKNYDKKRLKYVTTSGSTGIPLGFYIDKRTADAREWAFMTSQWSRVGYNIHERNRCVILRGNKIYKGIYEYDGLNLILSSYNLTDKNMKEYVKLIKKFNPDFIQAYPSSISILSDYMLENNIKIELSSLKAILCGSENIYDYQRKKISRAFNSKVYNWYGHTEQACLAGGCENNQYYHIFNEYGYTELIDEFGKDVTEDNGVGQIVATGFNNHAVPFIRYKTMDLAVNSNEICSCGRKYKLLKKIYGRLQEYILTSKGDFIICDMLTASIHSDIFDNVKRFQFYQDKKGQCIINIVKKDSYCAIDERNIIKELKSKLGDYVELRVNYVDDVIKTGNGKYKLLIQKLNIKNNNE